MGGGGGEICSVFFQKGDFFAGQPISYKRSFLEISRISKQTVGKYAYEFGFENFFSCC